MIDDSCNFFFRKTQNLNPPQIHKGVISNTNMPEAYFTQSPQRYPLDAKSRKLEDPCFRFTNHPSVGYVMVLVCKSSFEEFRTICNFYGHNALNIELDLTKPPVIINWSSLYNGYICGSTEILDKACKFITKIHFQSKFDFVQTKGKFYTRFQPIDTEYVPIIQDVIDVMSETQIEDNFAQLSAANKWNDELSKHCGKKTRMTKKVFNELMKKFDEMKLDSAMIIPHTFGCRLMTKFLYLEERTSFFQLYIKHRLTADELMKAERDALCERYITFIFTYFTQQVKTIRPFVEFIQQNTKLPLFLEHSTNSKSLPEDGKKVFEYLHKRQLIKRKCITK